MRLIDRDEFVSEIEKLKKDYGVCKTRSVYEDGLKAGRLLGYADAIYKANSLGLQSVGLKGEKILDFKGDYADYTPANYPPKENGYRMTIRCGLGGIYTHLDEWKDGHWMVGITDGSYVIAYTESTIPKETVEEWCKTIIEKDRRKRYEYKVTEKTSEESK